MKIENQVCSKEQSKRLKELGVCQDSYFFHAIGITRPCTLSPKEKIILKEWYSAFTVAELGVMLPDYYPSWRFKKVEKSGDRKWIATVICGPKPPGIDDIHTAPEFDRYAETQAEALATLLISLLECKVIKIEEVNQRLKAE